MNSSVKSLAEPLLAESRIFGRAQVLARPGPVPRSPGVYCWWFRDLPPGIDPSGCIVRDGLTLLYTGISPKMPPSNGRSASKQNLRKRILTHYTGNAAGSTLRRTLGCLLSDKLGLQLRRVGSSERLTFVFGEQDLSKWMADNAFVSWIEHPEPWTLEDHLISNLDLPLNLQGNSTNSFHPFLTARRVAAASTARTLPVLPNPGIGGA